MRAAWKDGTPVVRENAIRVAESLIKAGDASLSTDLLAMGQDTDPKVVIQAIGTAKRMNFAAWPAWSDTVIAASSSEGVKQIGKILTTAPAPRNNSFTSGELATLKRGESIYRELCFACHGMDGRGMAQEGAAPGATLGPPLAGSKTVTGQRDGGSPLSPATSATTSATAAVS